MDIKKIKEEDYLKNCLVEIQEFLHWDNSDLWRQRDFMKLSELIEEKTGYKLSITTLKRIWGKVSYEGNVGPTSLDALSGFLGYQDWMDYKMKKHELFIEKTPNINIKEEEERNADVKKWNKLYIMISAGLITGFILIIFFLLKQDPDVVNESDISFEVLADKGVVPWSVKFNFDVSSIKSDSVFIQAGDENRKHLVDKEDIFLTRIYFIPGKKTANLLVDDRVVKKIDLFAYTNGWLCFVKRSEKLHPVFLPEDSITRNNRLYVSPDELRKRNVDVSDYFSLNYYNIKHFNVDGDNFSFKCRVKNNVNEGGDICQKTNVGIITTDGFIVIPLVNKGCIALAKVFVSDIIVNGWTTDLSAFAYDLNEWNEVYYKVTDKKAMIYINNDLRYELAYEKSLGEVLGFRIEFQGCGAVDYVRLYDNKNVLVYEDDFGGFVEN